MSVDHSEKSIIPVDAKLPLLKTLPLSCQHLFAMFGASVLVPTLFHIDPSIVLLMNGIGTLIYLFICKGQSPAYLGSSCAFIAPVLAVMQAVGGSYEEALGGFLVTGCLFMVTAFLFKKMGTNWIDLLLPPSAMGAIVALIGLELAPIAAQMSGFITHDIKAMGISTLTLLTVMVGSLFFRGFLSTIPILIGIIVGYIASCFCSMVDFSSLQEAAFFKWPTFYIPRFHQAAILTIFPAALVTIVEHVGHLIVTGQIINKDLMKNPGLHRSLFADGVSTFLSALMGSVPTTTYAENMGVMAVTKVYSVWVIGGAAILSIILSFSGILVALIQSIPAAVMGGVSMLLFGLIVASGIRTLIETKVDYSHSFNLVMTAITFTVGVSGISLQLGAVSLKGMSLAVVVSLLINLLFRAIAFMLSLIRRDPVID